MGKKAISNIIAEYQGLIKERKGIIEKRIAIEDVLEMTPRKTTNLEEMCKEMDRLSVLKMKYTDILDRGTSDVKSLNEDELLTFTRLVERENSYKEEDGISLKILAMRQGILNISDKENSILDSKLSDEYLNGEEFIIHKTAERLRDFMRASDRLDTPELPEKVEVTDLVVNPEKYEQVDKIHPILKEFAATVIETQKRAGYYSKSFKPVPFKFAKSEDLEGEIIIEEVGRGRKDPKMPTVDESKFAEIYGKARGNIKQVFSKIKDFFKPHSKDQNLDSRE